MSALIDVLCHTEAVMGTVVSFDLRGAPEATAAVSGACRWLHHVDETFSPYRSESEISRIRDGSLRVQDASFEVRMILRDCDVLRQATAGGFDAYATGRLDPSGYVKGWAVERAADILEHHGCTDFMINAGGDIVTRGGALPGDHWRLGVRHPGAVEQLAAVLRVSRHGVATSGHYERPGHIHDPRSRRPATGLRAVTIVAADLGTADAWATAIYALGARDGLRALADAPAGIDGFVIAGDDRTWHTRGLPVDPETAA